MTWHELRAEPSTHRGRAVGTGTPAAEVAPQAHDLVGALGLARQRRSPRTARARGRADGGFVGRPRSIPRGPDGVRIGDACRRGGRRGSSAHPFPRRRVAQGGPRHRPGRPGTDCPTAVGPGGRQQPEPASGLSLEINAGTYPRLDPMSCCPVVRDVTWPSTSRHPASRDRRRRVIAAIGTPAAPTHRGASALT